MTAKLEPYDSKQTKWSGLWWHPEINGFTSAVIDLSELRKFKGKVRIYVRKNKFFNGGENGRPNYNFTIRDAASEVFDVLDVEDYDEEESERLYTRQEVIQVMHGACRDGQNGYDEFDCLIEDYL